MNEDRKKCVIPPSTDGEWKCDGIATQADGMCDSCRAFGWITDPTIIAQEIARDPELSKGINIVSPIQIDDDFTP